MPPMPSNSSTDVRTTRARQAAAICLFLTVCGLTAIPAVFLIEKYRGRAAWRDYEVEARQRGVKLDLADYLPAPVPEADNFAAIPIFQSVFAEDEAGRNAPDPFALPEGKDGQKPPKFADPVKSQRLDLAAWQRFFVEMGRLPVAGENAARDILRALESYAAPLAQLRAAGERPQCRFPVRYEKGFAAALPHLGLFQSAAKLYALGITAHLALGESAEACQEFQAGLRLVTATTGEPTLIAGLVRIAVCTVLQNAVWDGLAGHQWAEPELRAIESDLAALNWLADYRFAMGSERGGFNLMVDQLIKAPDMMAGIVTMADATQGTSWSKKWAFWLYPTGWHYQSKVRANRFFDETAARIDLAERRFYADRPVPSSPTNFTDWAARVRLMLFALATPVFENVEKRYLQIASVTDEARMACALERHRLTRSSYPGALAALVPKYLATLPRQVVNGEPYIYRRSVPRSFSLYSVGADLQDDGGEIDPKLSASKQKDWVWRSPAE